jgi:hypothetical protein
LLKLANQIAGMNYEFDRIVEKSCKLKYFVCHLVYFVLL